MTDAISMNTETIENDEGKEFLEVEGFGRFEAYYC